MIGFLLVAMVPAVAEQTPASAAITTSTFSTIPLISDLNIQGTVTEPEEVTVVLSKDLQLRAGVSLRVTDQLKLTLSSTEGAEVDNILACSYLDPNTGWQEVTRSSSGTNHPGSDYGPLLLSEALLLHTSTAGTYRCQVLSYTSDGRTDYHETARRYESGTGTWMRISRTDEGGSHDWQSRTCTPNGQVGCTYLGADGDPDSAVVFQQPGVAQDWWTAASDATDVDVIGTLQVTSCPHGTSSCKDSQWGDNGVLGTGAFKTKTAVVESWLAFDQLYPNGTVCRPNQTTVPYPDGQHEITNSVHHLPINYHLTAAVSETCDGSRTFRIGVYVRHVDGNPVKIDGGTFNVINSVRTDTTPVWPVVGSTLGQATAILQLQGFTPLVAGSLVNPAPPGTVVAQNSPGGTVEPTGSPVYLWLSLGIATVPDVRGDFEAAARGAILAAGFTVGTVSHPNTCVDPGTVSDQTPAPGRSVAPGTPVNLTVPGCGGGVPK